VLPESDEVVVVVSTGVDVVSGEEVDVVCGVVVVVDVAVLEHAVNRSREATTEMDRPNFRVFRIRQGYKAGIGLRRTISKPLSLRS